jgi:hypothetical protein
MSALFAVLGVALLFVAYGLLRPRHDCGGHCGTCEGMCAYAESQDEPT